MYMYSNPNKFVEADRLGQREAYALARYDLERRAERNKHNCDILARPTNLKMVIGCDIIIRGTWDDR